MYNKYLCNYTYLCSSKRKKTFSMGTKKKAKANAVNPVTGYCRPMMEIVETESSSVLCGSGDFRNGGTQEYDFGDTGNWDF